MRSSPSLSARAKTTVRSIPIVLTVLSVSAVASGAGSAGAALDEVSGARRVCEVGPAAAIARAQRLRGDAAVTAADVLPNPSLQAQHQQQLEGVPERETIVGLTVTLPVSGRRGLLQDAARARREQALADANATSFESALAFREAFAAAVLDEARLAALNEQQAALDKLAATVEGLAKGGESAGYDLLRQQSQVRIHRVAVASARARADASRALLEAWTGEAVTLPAVRLADLAGGATTPPVTPGTAATATAPEHPRVASLEAGARASALEAEAARRRWIPDLQVFAGYRTLTDATGITSHGISLQLTVPLTMFDHGQAEAAQADADHAVAKAAAGSLKAENAARAKGSARKLETLEASAADADQTVTDAAVLVTKAIKLYAAGEASITELLDAHRAAEEARLSRIDLAEEVALARLARMRAAGSQRDAALDKACGSGGASGAAAGGAK
jgi:cobalt-zinc-cadmium efflux system outer membrane protein